MDYSDIDELVDDTETPQYQEFEKAAEYLTKNHTNLTPDTLLELYALYKQGTVGDCNTSKPGIFNIQNRAKWNAWNDIRGKPQEQARYEYITKLMNIFPDWKQATKSPGWVAVSRQQTNDDQVNEETLADLVKNDDLTKVKQLLALIKPGEINELDESGLGLIHWCADRGHTDMMQLILNQPGINVNLQDKDGQTALHYTSSCGHVECTTAILNADADLKIIDNDGNSVLDVAYDEQVKQLICLYLEDEEKLS